MNKKISIFLVLLIFISSIHLFATTVDPAWFNIYNQVSNRISNNSINIRDEHNNIYMNYIKVQRDNSVISWNEANALWGADGVRLRWVFTAEDSDIDGNTIKLVNVENSDDYYPIQYTLDFSPTMQMTTTPETINSAVTASNNSDGHLRLSIRDHNKNPEGTYETSLHLQIFADFDTETTEDDVLIYDYTFFIQLYYIEPSPTTYLTVNPSSNAQNIDVQTLETSGGSLTVGNIVFSSNDSRTSSNYSLKISPKNDLYGGDFYFKNDANGAIFKYMVRIADPSYLPSPDSFIVDEPSIGPSGYWGYTNDIIITNLKLHP